MNAHAAAKNNFSLLMLSDQPHYFKDEAEYAPQPQNPPRGFFSRIGGVLRWIATLQRRRAVMGELAMLSDRELADIGLTRSNLSSVLDAAFAPQHHEELDYGRRFTS